MTDNKKKRKDQTTEARKRQILDAALSVFSRKGFGEATIVDIAGEAGIGIGTIYNYYKNKEDLLVSLLARNLISDNLNQLLNTTVVQDDKQFMELLLEDRFIFALGKAQELLFLFFEIQRYPKLRRQYVSQVLSPLIDRIEQYIHMKIGPGNFRNVNEMVISRALIGMIIGTMILKRLELRDSPYKKSGIKTISKELSNLVLYGLADKGQCNSAHR
jgi:AcrR family transcriptional regulator